MLKFVYLKSWQPPILSSGNIVPGPWPRKDPHLLRQQMTVVPSQAGHSSC